MQSKVSVQYSPVLVILGIVPLILTSDIFSINKLTPSLILKIMDQCEMSKTL
jgi:hypothetical protein